MENTKSYNNPFQEKDSLNTASFFKKGGKATVLGPENVTMEVGRRLDGAWYIQFNGAPTNPRLTMSPEQFFEHCAGGLVGLASWGFPQAEAIVKRWRAPR